MSIKKFMLKRRFTAKILLGLHARWLKVVDNTTRFVYRRARKMAIRAVETRMNYNLMQSVPLPVAAETQLNLTSRYERPIQRYTRFGDRY